MPIVPTFSGDDFQKRFVFYFARAPQFGLALTDISRRVASDQIAFYMRDCLEANRAK